MKTNAKDYNSESQSLFSETTNKDSSSNYLEPKSSAVSGYRIYAPKQQQKIKHNDLPELYPDLPDEKYEIIYADPPWTYPKTGGTKNSRGMAKQFYSTMGIDEIKSLPIQKITDENAILFLWCTYPQLPSGLEVIKAWGFDYFGLGFEWIKKTKSGKDFFGRL